MSGGTGGWATRSTAAAFLVAVVVAAVWSGSLPTTVAAASTPAAASGAGGSAGRPAPDLGSDAVDHGARSTADSLDWAGYVVTGTTVTSVSGSWTEPSVLCPTKKFQQSAFWVGIDGYAPSDPTVQQVGTDADCTKGSGKHPSAGSYYAWFEMYPAPLVALSPAQYPVEPGDSMSASVTASGTDYVLSIADAGHWTYSSTQPTTTAPLNSSAEWITEAPTSCTGTKCKVLPLADFGSVSFTGAEVNGHAVNATGQVTSQVTMTKNKKGTTIKASTSALDPTGHDFTVLWLLN